MSRTIKIFDTTLRDGEQSPGCSMNLNEKIEVAKQLEALKVDIIEAGFAAASPGDAAAIAAIADTVRGATICSLARSVDKDIEAAYNAIRRAESARIHTFIATSPVHMEYKLKMTREQVIDRIREMVAYAKSYCDDIEFSAEDASRSDWAFLAHCYSTAVAAGATTLNVPDTVGYSTPQEMYDLITYLRENIEGSNYETIVTNLMTRQIGCDREDLCLNGDEKFAKVKEFSSSATYAIGDLVAYNKKVYQYTASHTAGAFNAGEATELGTVDDADFLKVNDGWVKQFKDGGHVVDVSGINSGAMVLDVFYKGLRAVPDKFNNGSLRWLMSPHRRQEWERYILNQAVTAGGIITDKRVENPASVPVIEVPALPDDVIMLTDPKNLVVVNSYGVVIRKTTEGPEAIYQDKRFYVVHFDFDTLVEELDATAIVTGLASI